MSSYKQTLPRTDHTLSMRWSFFVPVTIKFMNGFKEFFSKNALTLTLQGVGVLVVFANLWVAVKLAPLAQDISSIATRVQAVENEQKTDDIRAEQLLPQFYVMQGSVGQIQIDIKDIKSAQLRIEDKIDRLR